MAKQNFIQGGFKGKLGAVVGQGWKDQLVLRSAGKPSNPRTPKQVAARSAFSLRVLASKLATQSNWNATFFEDPHSGRWGARMATCSKLFGTDKNLLEYVPLIPYGYSPAYPTTSEPEATSNSVTLAWDTEDDLTGRVMSVLIWAKSEADETYSAQLCVAPLAGASGAWTATATLPDGYIFDDETYVVAVSRSDELFSDKTLYQPPVLVGSPVPTTVFTLSAPAVWGWADGDQSYAIRLTPSVALPDTTLSNVRATARGVLQGDWVTGASTGDGDITNDEIHLYDFENLDSLGQRPQFVTGSTLTVSPFSFTADGMRYKFAGATFDLAETPTTQLMSVPSTPLAWDDAYGYIKVNSLSDWTTAGKASVALRTVWGDRSTSTQNFQLSFVQRSDGLYFRFESDHAEYWYGTTQSATPTGTATASRNGVSYRLDTSTAMSFAPSKTSFTTSVRAASQDSPMIDLSRSPIHLYWWLDNDYWYNPDIDLSDIAPDAVSISFKGTDYPVQNPTFEYDGTDAFSNTYLQGDVTLPSPSVSDDYTATATWNTRKEKTFTYPDSGGFTVTFICEAGTISQSGGFWE